MPGTGEEKPGQGFELVGAPYTPESQEGPEKAHTRLHIFRHGKKAGGNDVEHEVDLAMELSEDGWVESFAAGHKLERLPGARTFVAGTSRLRAQQTAIAEYAATHPDVTGDERSIDELMEKVGKTGLYDRVWQESRLDMPFVKGVTPGVERIIAAADDPTRGFLREALLMHQEDLAAGKGKGDSIHASEARNVADYIRAWVRKTGKIVGTNEAHLNEGWQGSHGGIQEALWIELLRATKSEADVEKLLALIPNGVPYNGDMQIDVEAESRDREPSVRIQFSVQSKNGEYEFNEAVPVGVLEKVLEDFTNHAVEVE